MKSKDISKSFFEVDNLDKKDDDNNYYSIFDNNKKLKTPKGNYTISKNERLLSLISDELNTKKILDPAEFSYYSIYCIEHDILDDFFPDFINNLENMLLGDVTLKSCAGPEVVEQMQKWTHLLSFLNDEGIKHPHYIQIFDVEEIKQWVHDSGANSIKNHKKLVKVMKSKICDLSNMEKSTLIAIYNMSQSIMYSYLLVKYLCNSNEFSHAVFSGMAVHPKMFEDELDENKSIIEGLLFYSNAIHNYLNVGLIKSAKDTWKELDELRSDPLFDYNSLENIADKISGNIDFEMLVEYLLTYNYRSGEAITPTNISKMIAKIGNSYKPNTVADLCCGIGNISRFFVYSDVDGYDINVGCIKLAKKLLPNVKFYNQCIIKSSINKKYDMVVAHIPFGMRMEVDGTRYQFEKLAIEKSISILKDKGKLLCVIPQSFLFSNLFKETRDSIINNHCLEEIVEIPPNSFTHTSIGSALIIIGKNGTTKSCKSSIYQKENNSLLKRKNFSKKQLLEKWVFIKEDKSKLKVEEFLKINKLQIEKIKLGDFSTIINGYSAKKDDKKIDGEFLFLGGRNIQDDLLVKTKHDSYLSGVRNDSSMKCIIKPGDIIISTLFKNRKIYQFKETDPKSIASNNIKIIRSDDNEYLMKYLQTDSFNEQFMEQCKIKLRGSVIPYLTSKDLAGIEIYKIPLDLLESKIVSKTSKESILSAINKIDNKVQKKLIEEILMGHFEDPIIKLSKEHESEVLEFKSSLRTDVDKRGIPQVELIHFILKSISALGNTKGGDLLIGVSDDNKIIGIEIDKFQNTDKFIQFLTQKIENHIKPNLLQIPEMITISHSTNSDNKTVCRVSVKSSNEPIIVLKDSKEYFYVRQGPTSEPLGRMEMIKYISKRFPDLK